MYLSYCFYYHRLFDGDETVAMITEKAAENAGLAHTERVPENSGSDIAKSSTEMIE
jgi:hypothetical protein